MALIRSGTPGHSHFSNIFPVNSTEGDLVSEKNLHTVSQLLEVDDLTGCLTTDENRALMEELTPPPSAYYTTSYDG